MPPSLSGIELKKKWKLGRLIGSGGCAEVYEVVDLRSSGGEELVAKVAPLPAGLPPAMKKGKKRKKTDQEKHADMLYYEYTLYNGYLREHGRVPKVMLVSYMFHLYCQLAALQKSMHLMHHIARCIVEMDKGTNNFGPIYTTLF